MNKKAVLSDQYVKRCILFILLLILPFRLAYALPEDYFISTEKLPAISKLPADRCPGIL